MLYKKDRDKIERVKLDKIIRKAPVGHKCCGLKCWIVTKGWLKFKLFTQISIKFVV